MNYKGSYSVVVIFVVIVITIVNIIVVVIIPVIIINLRTAERWIMVPKGLRWPKQHLQMKDRNRETAAEK